MNPQTMNNKIDLVLAELEAHEIEERIAPVKCWKNPDSPECEPVVALYGVEPVPEYGVPVD